MALTHCELEWVLPNIILAQTLSSPLSPHASKVLDVYAALASVEFLEPQALDTDPQRRAWLRQVKRLQVPIELVCSEESVRHYGERSKTMAGRVQ